MCVWGGLAGDKFRIHIKAWEVRGGLLAGLGPLALCECVWGLCVREIPETVYWLGVCVCALSTASRITHITHAAWLVALPGPHPAGW